MAPTFQEPHLAELHREVEEHRAQVRESFGGLSPGQLSWRPADDAWGVGQCMDHLVTTDRLYLDEIRKAVEEGRRKGTTRRGAFRGGRLGGWFARAAGPNVKMKVKAPKVFKPNEIEEVSPHVVERYLETQGELLRWLEEADGLDLDRLKIRSPVIRLVRFRLGDAFRIVVEHDKRHLDQARRVMEDPGFPGGDGGGLA